MDDDELAPETEQEVEASLKKAAADWLYADVPPPPDGPPGVASVRFRDPDPNWVLNRQPDAYFPAPGSEEAEPDE